MPRPKNKNELLSLSKSKFGELIELVESYGESAEGKTFPEQYLNRNIRDVLGHLYHWHLLFFEWYTLGMSGQKPAMPAEGYTWKDTPLLNEHIQKTYSNVPLTTVLDNLKHSAQKVTELIRSHSDLELFEKKRFKWTGSTSLGQYLISTSSSHYDWALKLIRKAMKK